MHYAVHYDFFDLAYNIRDDSFVNVAAVGQRFEVVNTYDQRMTIGVRGVHGVHVHRSDSHVHHHCDDDDGCRYCRAETFDFRYSIVVLLANETFAVFVGCSSCGYVCVSLPFHRMHRKRNLCLWNNLSRRSSESIDPGSRDLLFTTIVSSVYANVIQW